jgi:hypothetical protein
MQFVEKCAGDLGATPSISKSIGNDPAVELYRRAGYHDHARFLMTMWRKPGKH